MLLVALAVALALPTALLVRRALAAMEAERAERHRTLAERVFDEMERTLSAWLAQEEARPARHYRFYLDAGAGARSPLSHGRSAAGAEGAPFVEGAFAIDADGLHTPLLPAPAERDRARALGDWPPAEAVRREAEGVLAVARRALAEAGDEVAEAAPAPGTTVALGAAPAPAAERQARAPDAYDALQSLNRGAQLREERAERQKAGAPPGLAAEKAVRLQALEPAVPAPEAAAAAPPEARPSVSGRAAAEAVRERPPAEGEPGPGEAEARMREEDAAGAPARSRADWAPPLPLPRRDPGGDLGAAALRDAPMALPAESVDPFHGRLLDDHVVLLRTVVADGSASRQGLVLDVDRLGASLREEVLAPTGLEGAALALRGVGTPAPGAPGDGARLRYRHRFAEPFDVLVADLALPPLPGASGAGTVWALAALLAVVGAAGLLAVERMVSVAVAFAERRSRFVASVSHELKTPLTAIRLHGEMLREGMVPDEAKRQAAYATITSEAERLSRLIGNVLELSRLERDARPLELVAGPIGPVLEELAGSLRPHLVREGFALELDVAPGLPEARFDRDALLQVLFNLVDNAVKYAGASGPRRIRVEARAAPEGGVRLGVRDFGPGVAPRDLGRLFEPFHRGDGPRERRVAGSGIGLALVRGLVERMGGGVEGRNAADGGFEVRLTLRAA